MVVSAQGPTRIARTSEDRAEHLDLTEAEEFDRLYEEFVPRVRGLVRRLVGPDHVVEDIVQEAFLRAYNFGLHRERRQTDLVDSPWPWLAAVARNLSLDHLRRRRSLFFNPIEEAALPSEDDSTEPESEIAALSQREGIAEVLGGVSARHRRVLVLKHVEGLSYRDIADREGVSVEALKSVLARARRAFRESYAAVAERGGLGVVLGPIMAGARKLRSLKDKVAGSVTDPVWQAWSTAPAAMQAAATAAVLGVVAVAGPVISSSPTPVAASTERLVDAETRPQISIAKPVRGVDLASASVATTATVEPPPVSTQMSGSTAEEGIPAEPAASPSGTSLPASVPQEASIDAKETVPIDDSPAGAQGRVERENQRFSGGVSRDLDVDGDGDYEAEGRTEFDVECVTTLEEFEATSGQCGKALQAASSTGVGS